MELCAARVEAGVSSEQESRDLPLFLDSLATALIDAGLRHEASIASDGAIAAQIFAIESGAESESDAHWVLEALQETHRQATALGGQGEVESGTFRGHANRN